MTAQPASPYNPLPTVDLNALTALYRLDRVREVQRFLVDNHYLVPLLLALPEHIEAVFNAQLPLTLELAVNPEYPQETGIIVSVPCDTGTDEQYGAAQQRLRQFQRGWWRTVVPQTQGKLSVDLG